MLKGHLFMKTLILASGSASRREILGQTGYPFIVEPSNFEEDMSLAMPPTDLALFLSRGKAEDVAKRHKHAVILAADSFGVFKGELLGKPHTIARAKEMLSMLSGQEHSFITGFTIIESDTNKKYQEAVETKVSFKELSPSEIDNYIASENVLDKAGAYAVQGLGGSFITKIDGDINNVQGLPLDYVIKALTNFGIKISKDPTS